MALIRDRAALLLALLVPVFAWAGLTYPGYFEVEHGFRPIFNLTDLARNLPALGWMPAVGQPYDLLAGEGALAYWLALAPLALGAAPAAAIKWLFATGLICASVGMYAWARRTFDAWAALVAAIVYVLWPFGLATVYSRGALAEATLLAGLPWLLWLAAGQSRRNAAALAIGLAAAIGVQAGLALWFAAVLVVYRVGMAALAGPLLPQSAADRPSEAHAAPARVWAAALAGGVLLGLFGLTPAALRHGLTGQTGINFGAHFVHLYQLMQAGWSAGSSSVGPIALPPFQLGLITCSLATLGFVLPETARSADPDPRLSAFRAGPASGQDGPAPGRRAERFTARYALAVVLILALLATTLAAPIWRILAPLQGTLTYPWQLLLLTGPWLAWLAGAGARALFALLPDAQREVGTPLVAACLLTLTLLGSYGYLRPTLAVGPAPAAPLAIFGDNEIALLDAAPTIVPPAGATTPGLQAGATISVTVRWQALRPLERDYTVFLHLTDGSGQLQGQQDTMPQNNELPTTRWRPGQVVADQYRVTLKPGAPTSNDYTVYLGLYLWQTGQRLRTINDDKVAIKP